LIKFYSDKSEKSIGSLNTADLFEEFSRLKDLVLGEYKNLNHK